MARATLWMKVWLNPLWKAGKQVPNQVKWFHKHNPVYNQRFWVLTRRKWRYMNCDWNGQRGSTVSLGPNPSCSRWACEGGRWGRQDAQTAGDQLNSKGSPMTGRGWQGTRSIFSSTVFFWPGNRRKQLCFWAWVPVLNPRTGRSSFVP